MKLNDFLDKSTKPSSSVQKIITLTNEKRENELMDEVDALTQELSRMHNIDKANLTLTARVQDVEGHLKAVMQSEQELQNTNGRLQLAVEEGDVFRSDNQALKNDLTNVTNQVGIGEAVLEQSKKNNLNLNLRVEALTKQLKTLEGQDDGLKVKLEHSLQQTATSLVRFRQMHEQFEDTNKMFQANEVKYKEEQHKNSGLTREVAYWTSVANTLQEERDELEQTRQMLKELAANVEADNVEKKGTVKITQGKLKKLRGTVAIMTTNVDNLVQENQRLSESNSVLKAELSRPKYMSMTAIQHSEGFKLPTGGQRKHFLGNSKPTLLKFKGENDYGK